MFCMTCVYQGDVGGGHYYAYIRPNGSVGMDYEAFAAHAYTDLNIPYDSQDANNNTDGGEDGSADMSDTTRNLREIAALKHKEELNAAARNGQWLKFNDETVLKVGN